jgi:hypothetical protein
MKSRTTFTGLTRVFILRAHYKKGAIVIEYLDEIGRKRTAPDGRNQYLNESIGGLPPHGKSWHLVDGWSKDLAGKLIAIGLPEADIEDYKREAKELPVGTKRSDEAKGCLHAYSFFVNLANIAIEAGLLKENDKPTRWLEWAESKGYATAHLTKYMGKTMSNDDAVFFARIDEMLRPFLMPIDYEQANTPAAMLEAGAMIPTAIQNACAELALKFAMMEADAMIPPPAATAEAAADTTPFTNDDHNETLANLFDPVTVETLAKMFPTDKLYTTEQWKKWAERAQRCGLVAAREGRNMFNPYKAGMWFLTQRIEGWDNDRLYRTLARNLPVRSRDEKWQLTGEMD